MVDTSDDPVSEKATDTPIDWDPGKNVTVKIKKDSVFQLLYPSFDPTGYSSHMGITTNLYEQLHIDEYRKMEVESDYEMGIGLPKVPCTQCYH